MRHPYDRSPTAAAIRMIAGLALLFAAGSASAQTARPPAPGAQPSSQDSGIPTARDNSAGSPIGYVDGNRLVNRLKVRYQDAVAAMDARSRAEGTIAQIYGLDIVLENAVWVDPRIDITEDVANEALGNPVDRGRLEAISHYPVRLGFLDISALRTFITKFQPDDKRDPRLVAILNDSVTEVARDKKLLIVFQDAVWASAKIDLTSEVIRRMQAKLH